MPDQTGSQIIRTPFDALSEEQTLTLDELLEKSLPADNGGIAESGEIDGSTE